MASEYAEVYKKGKFAATLERGSYGLRFSYAPNYIAVDNLPIATTLPLSTAPITNSNGAAPAYFAGLLPEGRRLNAIAKRIRASIDDDFSLLVDIGSDLIGDVQVIKPGFPLNDDRGSIKFHKNELIESFISIRNEYFGMKSTGLPGFQDKISARMLSARSRIDGREAILKFNPDDVPFAAENEHFFLNLAKKCGIKTAENYLVQDSQGVKALVVERFDRLKQNEESLRLAAEDGCQVLNRYPSDKMKLSLEEVANGLIKNCPARGVAAYEFFKQVVFSWLTGNGDTHAKNFSILENSLGEWEISPAYDLLCTRFYDDRDMALPLQGEVTGWSRSSLLRFATEIGLPEKVADSVIRKQLTVLSVLPSALGAGALPFARHLNFDVESFLNKRARRLEG